MIHTTKKEAFAYFGAIQKNERWSWAAATPGRDKVVITIWKHELQGKGKEQHYDTRELAHVQPEDWQDQAGNIERIELLKHAKNNLDGLLYVVLCDAVVENVHPHEIRNVYPWKSDSLGDHRMKLTFFDENTGDYRVEYLDSVHNAK